MIPEFLNVPGVLGIGEIGNAAARRHTAMSIDRRANHRVDSISESRVPRLAVADARRARGTRLMALAALRLHHLLAGAQGGYFLCTRRFRPLAT